MECWYCRSPYPAHCFYLKYWLFFLSFSPPFPSLLSRALCGNIGPIWGFRIYQTFSSGPNQLPNHVSDLLLILNARLRLGLLLVCSFTINYSISLLPWAYYLFTSVCLTFTASLSDWQLHAYPFLPGY